MRIERYISSSLVGDFVFTVTDGLKIPRMRVLIEFPKAITGYHTAPAVRGTGDSNSQSELEVKHMIRVKRGKTRATK